MHAEEASLGLIVTSLTHPGALYDLMLVVSLSIYVTGI